MAGFGEAASVPGVRVDGRRLDADLVHVEPDRLPSTPRPRPPQAGGGREHERAAGAVFQRLELPALGDGGLVDMAAHDELGTRSRQRLQHGVASSERPLSPRSPRRCRKVVVERDHT